jgi:surface carbohydrate biosynthesis protein
LVKRFPIVYLPVEFRSREFDGKASLAATLAKRGYSVLLGEQWTIYNNFHHLPPGAVLFKSFTNLHRVAMHEARTYHHAAYVLEEELLAHTQKKVIATFCAPEIFTLPDMIFATSEFEKNVLTEMGGDARKIEVTGNPRVDVLKPEFQAFFKREIDIVRGHFDDFVLVNTNFPMTNSIWRALEDVKRSFIDAGFLKLDEPHSVKEWDDKIEFETANKAAMLTAIKELSRRRPALKIVVRPHPGEGLQHWAGVFDGFPNVAIVREGPHVPWTLAARLLLHTSCTTGFEARVAGKMAMSLVAKPSWLSESYISNRLNPVFSDPIALVDAAEAYLDRGEAPPLSPSHLSASEAAHYVWNMGNKNSTQRLSTLLTKDLPSPRAKVPLPPLVPYDRGDTHKKKFTVSLQECGDVLSRIIGISGKGQPFGLDQVGDSLFYLSPAAK